MAAVVAFGLAQPACRPAAPVRRPNILLITVDTLRADHLSSYGYARATTPFIDRLAAAQLVDRRLERAAHDAGLVEDALQVALVLGRGEHEQLAGDVLVTTVLRQLVADVQ